MPQLVAESVHAALGRCSALIPAELPRWLRFSIDARVLGFALAVSVPAAAARFPDAEAIEPW